MDELATGRSSSYFYTSEFVAELLLGKWLDVPGQGIEKSCFCMKIDISEK